MALFEGEVTDQLKTLPIYGLWLGPTDFCLLTPFPEPGEGTPLSANENHSELKQEQKARVKGKALTEQAWGSEFGSPVLRRNLCMAAQGLNSSLGEESVERQVAQQLA